VTILDLAQILSVDTVRKLIVDFGDYVGGKHTLTGLLQPTSALASSIVNVGVQLELVRKQEVFGWSRAAVRLKLILYSRFAFTFDRVTGHFAMGKIFVGLRTIHEFEPLDNKGRSSARHKEFA